MRIILVAKPWRGGLAKYLHQALCDLELGEVEWISTYPTNHNAWWQYRFNKKQWRHQLVQRIKKTNYDVAIFLTHLPEFNSLSKRDNHITWLADDPTVVLKQPHPYGQVFITDPGYQQDVKKLLQRNEFQGILSFAYHPKFHALIDHNNQSRELCFIGNKDVQRDQWLKTAFQHQLPLKIYGNYFFKTTLFWQHPLRFLPAVHFEKQALIYQRYLGSVNFHAQVIKGGTNMRTFECAAFGIPQLVEYKADIEQLFEPDKEVLLFNSVDELLEQYNRLLSDAERTKKMIAAARQRVEAEHSYHHRVKSLLKNIILS